MSLGKIITNVPKELLRLIKKVYYEKERVYKLKLIDKKGYDLDDIVTLLTHQKNMYIMVKTESSHVGDTENQIKVVKKLIDVLKEIKTHTKTFVEYPNSETDSQELEKTSDTTIYFYQFSDSGGRGYETKISIYGCQKNDFKKLKRKIKTFPEV